MSKEVSKGVRSVIAICEPHFASGQYCMAAGIAARSLCADETIRDLDNADAYIEALKTIASEIVSVKDFGSISEEEFMHRRKYFGALRNLIKRVFSGNDQEALLSILKH